MAASIELHPQEVKSVLSCATDRVRRLPSFLLARFSEKFAVPVLDVVSVLVLPVLLCSALRFRDIVSNPPLPHDESVVSWKQPTASPAHALYST